ncbi:MAG: DNA-binding response regulator [Chloroflexi bacterium]|nr:MAG: LuxR family transcriptional regulator [Anaerolineaceae bacterium 4572_32.2]RLC76983.1 MAG: DNA-binding response regulator [Chloroflexota bacterium]RLC83222.1 MAG: DNA-binding response regulator [Chloroflexota bacterium]HEY73642.1 response regulator transcription factor [Thermoflexia bacterium]
MSKTRTLLADDHALVRAGIRNALEELADLEIVGEVGDGPALTAALEQMQPDCLLIDVAMPDFDPVPAIRQIRASYPDLKILVVSAYDDDIYVQGLLGAGVDGYHLKDQPLSDLQLAVQRVLAGGRWVSGPLVDKLVSYASAPPPATLPSLTTRQRDLLHLLQQGLDNQTIAQRLGLSVKTIENHLTRLYRLLNVQSRLEAVNYVMKHPRVLALSGQTVALAPTSPGIAVHEPVTVLLVDDNARYRRQLRRMIGKIYPQATIYEAENIGEAVNLTERVMPHLALVDVILGEEDGIRCTRRIRALSPRSRVILISAYPDREFHRLGLEAGAAAFLDKKDLETATLRHIIEDMIA